MSGFVFSGQVVGITGASSGIGEALAVAFSAAGARLVLSARRRHELDRVAEKCAGAEVLVLPMDLSKNDAFDELAAQVHALQRFLPGLLERLARGQVPG